MDPHQDIVSVRGQRILFIQLTVDYILQFSRFSGGDGAPYWALLAAGMEPRNFTRTNAAIIHCEWPDPDAPDSLSLPDMIWATGYQRLAAQTLTTLFFSGRDYAPKCVIDGVNIQDYLQQHYFKALSHFATRLAAFEDGALLDSCIVGWDSINEPNPGYVGHDDLSQLSPDDLLRVGPMPTPFQAMQLGMGQAVEVEKWKFTSTGPAKDGMTVIDPRGAKAWLSTERDQQAAAKYGWKRNPGWKVNTCIWAQHGVWDASTFSLLKARYFHARKDGPEAIFGNKHWKEHWRNHAKVVRGAHPEAIHFVHTPVFKIPPYLADLPEIQKRAAFSTHFYDGVTLVTKHWNWFNYDAIGVLRGKYRFQWQGIRLGERAVRDVMQSQIGTLRQDGVEALGNYPSYMGEIGIPFDLDGRKSYTTGDYTHQTQALDASLNGCDGENAMNYTIWNFCKDNSHLRGDQWVGEDLSIWSPDDVRQGNRDDFSSKYSSNESLRAPDYLKSTSSVSQRDANDGARAILAFVRPHPTATKGVVKNLSFDIHSTTFKLDVEVPSGFKVDADVPTEIYLPAVHYGAAQSELKRNDSDSIQLRLSEEPQELALEVKVSAGTWEVEGQQLRWFYQTDLEASDAGTPQQFHIEIKRKGGAKVTLQELYGQPQSWSEAALESVSHFLSLFESVCTKSSIHRLSRSNAVVRSPRKPNLKSACIWVGVTDGHVIRTATALYVKNKNQSCALQQDKKPCIKRHILHRE